MQRTSGKLTGFGPSTRTLVVAALALVPGPSGQSSAERGGALPPGSRQVELIDNGNFLEQGLPGAGVPWWLAAGSAPVLVPEALGGAQRVWLELAPGATLRQPFAAYAPLAAGIELSGLVKGAGELSVFSANGARRAVHFDVGSEQQELRLRLDGNAGEQPVLLPPRYTLELSAAPDSSASFTGISARVPLPCPGAEELRSALVEELVWLYTPWLERGLDVEGTKATSFYAREFDAQSGETLRSLPRTTAFPTLYAQLLDAWEVEPRPEWGAALERWIEDALSLGLQPDTGLPRLWDPQRDQPLDGQEIEIAFPLRMLIDLAERGPQARRPRCRAAAERIGLAVLERGLLPDGSIAPLYRPKDGRPSNAAVPIRRLDVPAELVRLARWVAPDLAQRYRQAAHEALLEVQFTHIWPGSWQSIDPGFDDTFGHFGERSTRLWRNCPEDPAFRDFALSGFAHFAPLWRDALRHGGNVAADQVRCWRIFREQAELEPELAPQVEALLGAAVRSHFKGGQAESGAWIDVTIKGFTHIALPVGDTGGVPQNLLEGLAAAQGHAAGLDAQEQRALFCAVYAATQERYRMPFGYTASPRPGQGAQSAEGSLRVGAGLVAMLRSLSGR